MKLFDLAATSAPVFFRTYSRWLGLFGRRETWAEVVTRCAVGFSKIGNLKPEQLELIAGSQVNGMVMPSGRWLWVGGTDWIEKQANFYGSYNCNSTNIDTLESFANVMDLLMQGCGVGVCLESKYVDLLPPIINKVHINIIDYAPVEQFLRLEDTEVDFEANNCITITVGDSRQGWTEALYQILCIAALDLETETGLNFGDKYTIKIDLSNIRPDGERIEGFGGVSKSAGLSEFFKAIAEILNETQDYKLTPVQCALLVCTIGKIVVAGNVRRSAIIQQFDADNLEAQQLKSGMWKQVGDDWIIDPKLDCMRMANLTRVFHKKPTLQQCIDSVTEQFESGEGAIQWAGEAVARSNADLLNSELLKSEFLHFYQKSVNKAANYLAGVADIHALDPEITVQIKSLRRNFAQ
jgi:ribonucleotide reductase, class II